MTQYIPQLVSTIGVLVVLVNIIVEVAKPFTVKYVPTNAVAVAVSLILTLVAFFSWMSYTDTPVKWYMVTAAIVVGVMVAYAAMFGFDKLKQAIASISKGKAEAEEQDPAEKQGE